jgi:hypothetical protein
LSRKRKDSDTDSEASQGVLKPAKKVTSLPVEAILEFFSDERRAGNAKKTRFELVLSLFLFRFSRKEGLLYLCPVALPGKIKNA